MCKTFLVKMIFYYHTNKTHFHKKGFALGLVLRVRVLVLGNGLLNACNCHQAQENTSDQLVIGFSFASDWLSGCQFSRTITDHSKAKPCKLSWSQYFQHSIENCSKGKFNISRVGSEINGNSQHFHYY